MKLPRARWQDLLLAMSVLTYQKALEKYWYVWQGKVCTFFLAL